MSRRRVQKQAEQEVFLEQNPELITFETRFEVVEVEQELDIEVKKGGGNNRPTQYEVEVTRDGEELKFYAPNVKGDRDLTQVSFVESEAGGLSTGQSQVVMPWLGDGEIQLEIGNEYALGRDVITLSENGFGVSQAQSKKGDGPQVVAQIQELGEKGGGRDREPPSIQDYALDGDEVLIFRSPDMDDSYPQDNIRDGRTEDLGTTEFGIDFTVLSGRGTVEIVLVDYDGNETVQAVSGTMMSGSDGSLEAIMAEGTYEEAHISVTGNLEIGIVGIDVTSNTDSGDFFSA